MRTLLRLIFPAVLLATFLGSPALAQTKIGTVDMQKIVKNYWKTKQAQAAIDDRKLQLAKDDKSMVDDLRKASDDYEKLLVQANDSAISSDERDKRKSAVANKLKEMNTSKGAIDQFERQAQATLADQFQRMQLNILTEIKNAVASKAKAAGLSLVVDSSATAIVLYTNGENDLTDAVLAELNAGAPIDMSRPLSSPNSPPPLTK
jgi:Skp family chaperone for outer membrane proteins